MREMKDSGIEWIGEIPVDWDTIKLKYLVSLQNEKTKSKNAEAPYVGLEHVASEMGRLAESYIPIADFDGDTIDFQTGDILFGKLRPYLAKAFESKFDGRCSSEFWVMRPKEVNARFLLYSVLSNNFIACIDHSTFGVKMPRAEWDFAGTQEIAIPSQPQQAKIATYLDQKCAEIDALILAKEKTNALLRERRQSIIYEAVTKGLDPDAPMKDSGIEWIGKIPEHWNIKKLNYLFGTIGSGTTPNTANSDFYDGEIDWVNTGDLNDGYLYGTQKTVSQLALETFSALKEYNEDSIIIAMYGATIGKVAIAKMKFTANQACCVLSEPKECISKYVYYWLLQNKENIISLSYGGGQPNISQETIRSLKIQLPQDIDEQEQIVLYLDAKCSEIDVLISANTATIDKLKEYRRSVIYEAVTGKIEI